VADLRAIFGARVRALRTSQGLSQEELAERADLHWTYISGIERGVRNPGLNTISKLARGLKVDVEVLFKKDAPARRGRHGE
jgi:transcriptional regulator with XRE-family HTH domain